MSVFDFARVVVRFSAVLVFFYGIRHVIELIDFFAGERSERPLYVDVLYVFWAVLPVFLAVYLWLFPRKTFLALSGGWEAESFVSVGSDVLRLVVVGIGLFFSVGSIPDILYFVSDIVIFRVNSGWWSFEYKVYLDLSVSVFSFALGLWLSLFSNGVATWLMSRP